jgi:hypothetical protein
MSLLSQLVPRHLDSVVTVRIAGPGMQETPTVTQPDAYTTSWEPPGRCVDDATTLTLSLLSDACDDPGRARLAAGVDEYVDVWTPALHTTSRFELLAVLNGLDDAITDVAVTFTDAVHTGSTALLAWIASGRFSHPAFLDDDHLVEPSGAVIRIAGATSVSFTADHRADRIRCYYDRLGIVEQMMAPHP